MLVVIGVIVILLGLIVPAFTTIGGGADLTKSSYDVAGALEEARAYAMANNTYTWVGFFEENNTLLSAGTNPTTAGTGRVVISVVASRNATKLYADTAAAGAFATPAPSQGSATAIQVDKLIKVGNVHLQDLTANASPTPRPVSGVYEVASNSFTSPQTFYYPLSATTDSAATYKFAKVIQFSPLGDASRPQDSPSQVIEIGLYPVHGTTVAVNPKNYAAIEVNGIGGHIGIYRP